MVSTAAKKADAPFDPKAFLAAVNHDRTVAKYRKGNVIFHQGDPAEAGLLRSEGQGQDCGCLQTGQGSGDCAPRARRVLRRRRLIGQPLWLATAQAMADSVVMRVGKTEMMRVVHDEPAFGELFIAHLLIRNSKVEEDLVDQLFNSSENRLARTLLMLANFGKADGPQPITTKISHKTLAEIIGTTRPRVSHFMKNSGRSASSNATAPSRSTARC
jgi:CRP/FNR family cyclic AMP-dependent transcriptional regulator